MALTIDDIYDKEFALKGGGYDRDDVDQFLDEICDEMISMQERLTAMEGDLVKARQELKAEREAVKPVPQPVEREEAVAPTAKTSETLESILISAQRLSDEAIANAKAKAEQIVKEAEDKAGQIVDDAQEEKQTIEKGLAAMKTAASEYRQSFIQLIKKHQDMLEEGSELFGDKK